MSENCSNCYNGCAQIVSDQCVKYTGIDVPVLGIKTGDSLSYVEQALVSFLSSTLDGTGIQPIIASGDICEYVHQYFPVCETVTLNDVLTALIKATCAIRAQIVSTNNDVASLNADYTILCLSGVTASSDTHAIVQSIISKLCQFITVVNTNFVKISDLDELIRSYLDTIAPSTKYNSRMVPYTVVEYYGSLSNFDLTGAGTGAWEKIYLCNGQNGTPDKRGRVAVGAIVGVPGGALDAAVDPGASPFNQNYDISGPSAINGSNKITLDLTQIPGHTHGVTDPGHSHSYAASALLNNSDAAGAPDYVSTTVGATGSSYTNISINSAGGGQPHSNVQPVRACYYIMYIP